MVNVRSRINDFALLRIVNYVALEPESGASANSAIFARNLESNLNILPGVHSPAGRRSLTPGPRDAQGLSRRRHAETPVNHSMSSRLTTWPERPVRFSWADSRTPAATIALFPIAFAR
jgi:hypothetical protein